MIKKILIFLFSSLTVCIAQESCVLVARDPATNMEWEAKTALNYKALYSYQEASEYCSKLIICGRKWRIPTLSELQTLLDTSRIPNINTRLFPYTVADLYWSSTYSKDNSLFSYGLSFGSGIATIDHEGGSFYVRCIAREAS
ncbi:MAG TPA: DUF1566 domain-containing protein [Campylobacterales bacterium]|nr:DUF1566 domain-containing protein [Campylobacterales bacterium]